MEILMKRIVLLLVLVALPLSATEKQRYLVSFDRDPLTADERLARHVIRFERGYSVELTADEAAALSRRDGVQLVERDEEHFVSTMQPAPRVDDRQLVTPMQAAGTSYTTTRPRTKRRSATRRDMGREWPASSPRRTTTSGSQASRPPHGSTR
jgi:hypothetical protein